MTYKYIPPHLEKYIVDQDYSRYTAIDQTCWRYILQISKDFFKNYAHDSFLEGLNKFGISSDKIPKIEEMDQKLAQFGWGAVCVRGFIPPAAFMELQSLQILAIAADMRSIAHLIYTPAPDIVHEAAGHAPIITDPDYAEYLKQYGLVAKKAIASKEDTNVYNAIRDLSDLKEFPDATEIEIKSAEFQLVEANRRVSYISEAAYMTRMNWWTVEYGLIGEMDKPRIYGAGLLSSVGESYNCLNDEVTKIPFSVDCINYPYDITEPQPQLFITPDFKNLINVLNEYSKTMAYQVGGKDGLDKALQAETVNTCEYENGLQVSGVLSQLLLSDSGNPSYMQFSGHVQLAYKGRQLSGHGGDYHHEGFGSPIGDFLGTNTSTSNLTRDQLESFGITLNSQVQLDLQGGINLKGILSSFYEVDGKILLLSFSNCSVKEGDRYLFKPEWGVFDMACGSRITSVFAGPSDIKEYGAYLEGFKPKNEPPHGITEVSKNDNELIRLYERVEHARFGKNYNLSELKEISDILERHHPDDWLLNMVILEIVHKNNLEWVRNIRKKLEDKAGNEEAISTTIKRGLLLINGG